MSRYTFEETFVKTQANVALSVDPKEQEIVPRGSTKATEIDLREFDNVLEIYRDALSPTSISIGTVPASNERIAIKKIFKRDLTTAFQKQQAAEEFHLHCALKHEKIIKGLEWSESDREYTMVMEYMDNPCYFQEKIDRDRRPIKHEAKMKSYITDILQALSYLHSKGIVHGDLKFENLLINNKQKGEIPTVKLCDFGLSRTLDNSTKKFFMETPVGTCGYMAPEIKANSYVDEKIDLWALGIILYKMTVAYRPTQVAGYKYGTGPIPFRACDWRKKSPELQDLVKRFLETDPAQRISAEEALQHPWFQI